jgi:hypothetical protein
MYDEELNKFLKMFTEYFEHIRFSELSLLARIYGIFTIKVEDLAPVHLLLMGNTMKVQESFVSSFF